MDREPALAEWRDPNGILGPMSPPYGCAECAAIVNQPSPLGGMLFEDENFVVHGVLGPTPLPGWLVVAPRQHVERLPDLDPARQARWFDLATHFDRLLREILGAEKVYLALFAEVVAHLHLHLIPRFAATPSELRGPRCFLAKPEDAIPRAEALAALAQLRAGAEPRR